MTKKIAATNMAPKKDNASVDDRTSYSESPQNVIDAYRELGQALRYVDLNTKYWN
jgi:hypothetical protein